MGRYPGLRTLGVWDIFEGVVLAILGQSFSSTGLNRNAERLNLAYYPPAVTELVLTEPYPPMLQVLRNKLQQLGRKATLVEASAESLPFPDASFDTVVATMILCSADRPEPVLEEIARVLKPGGQYLLLEHVHNPNEKIARKQDRLQPGWYLFRNGCHCNRDTVSTLKRSGLEIEEIREGQIPHAWKIIEAMITGRVRRPLDKKEVVSRDERLDATYIPSHRYAGKDQQVAM